MVLILALLVMVQLLLLLVVIMMMEEKPIVVRAQHEKAGALYSSLSVCLSICPSTNGCGCHCGQGVEVSLPRLGVWTTHEV